jgi:hypothetical protein
MLKNELQPSATDCSRTGAEYAKKYFSQIVFLNRTKRRGNHEIKQTLFSPPSKNSADPAEVPFFPSPCYSNWKTAERTERPR